MDTTGTIEFLGEDNFLKICRKWGLDSEEIEIVRGIIKEWDRICDEIEDFWERQMRKLAVVAKKIGHFSPERQERIFGATGETNVLFVQLSLRRH